MMLAVGVVPMTEELVVSIAKCGGAQAMNGQSVHRSLDGDSF